MPRASTNLASTVRLLEMQEARGKMQRKDAEHKRHERNFWPDNNFCCHFAEKEKLDRFWHPLEKPAAQNNN